jgi:manganese transport protein
MTFLPLLKQRREKQRAVLHGETAVLNNLEVKSFGRIAIALDFSKSDEKLIAHALAQGHAPVTYVLLHVVESVSARYLGEASDDDETRRDKLRIQNYAEQLKEKGHTVETYIGYRNRVSEIIRIVKESGADMLVMGAHRHSGLKDYIFGETIEDVRHKLPIPVLIVNV